MTESAKPHPDPLIDEVRERRAQLFRRVGGTLEGLFEEIQRIQAEHPEKVVDRRAVLRKNRGHSPRP